MFNLKKGTVLADDLNVGPGDEEGDGLALCLELTWIGEGGRGSGQ